MNIHLIAVSEQLDASESHQSVNFSVLSPRNKFKSSLICICDFLLATITMMQSGNSSSKYRKYLNQELSLSIGREEISLFIQNTYLQSNILIPHFKNFIIIIKKRSTEICSNIIKKLQNLAMLFWIQIMNKKIIFDE